MNDAIAKLDTFISKVKRDYDEYSNPSSYENNEYYIRYQALAELCHDYLEELAQLRKELEVKEN